LPPRIRPIQKRKREEYLNSIRKIQAFTLGELLVVMVVSSIVVTISFMALGNVQKQIRLVNKTFEKQQKILKLERLLMSDLNASKATFDIQSKTITFQSNADTVQYKLLDKNIIRQEDTLDIATSKLTLYLHGEKTSTGKFDAMEFLFSDTYNQQGFFIYKRNDASHYINE